MIGVWYVILVSLCTAALQPGSGRELSFRKPEGPLPLENSGTGGDSTGPLKSESYDENQEDYAENADNNSSDYVRQFSYDPSMKDLKNTISAKSGERAKRKSEQTEEDGALAELKDVGGSLSRVVAGCVPRSLTELARNYKWMVAATKQFIKAANRTVMERVLEECACVSMNEMTTCEPPVDIACLAHRGRRKEEPREEYEEYEEEGDSKLIAGRGGQTGRELDERQPEPRSRRSSGVSLLRLHHGRGMLTGDDEEAEPDSRCGERSPPALGDHAAT